MKHLWAPWRIDYILGPKPDACIFCLAMASDSHQDRYVLFQGQHCFVLLNAFPYATGHLMVSPCRHLPRLDDLRPEESSEMMGCIQDASRILFQALACDGLNIGCNLGEAAGAGIDEHLHFHLVPRWSGDHSFMAVFGQTMVLPEHLQATYAKLRPAFQELGRSRPR